MKVRKKIQSLDPEKSLLAADNETKIESKSSGADTPKIDGSIVGIPKSNEIDKALKITEGDSMFDTPQKYACGKTITPNAKNQEDLVQKD